MSEHLQDVLVAALAFVALGWLVWRRLRARRRTALPCGDCPGCSADPAAPDRDSLVSIGEPERPAR